jgi:hypothetical protein
VFFQQTILYPQTYCHASLPQPLMHAFNKISEMNIHTSTPKATTAKTFVKEVNFCTPEEECELQSTSEQIVLVKYDINDPKGK